MRVVSLGQPRCAGHHLALLGLGMQGRSHEHGCHLDVEQLPLVDQLGPIISMSMG